MRTGILEPDGFSPAAWTRLAAHGPVEGYDGGDPARFLSEKSVLFVRLGRKIDAALLGLAPRLRWLVSPTTGHTHIDLQALERAGVELVSLKGERAFLDTIRATPEHTLGLILALLRRYRTAFLSLGNAHWDRDACRGEEVAGLAVGIIGYGRVGQRLARYLEAMDAEIHWCDPAVEQGIGVRHGTPLSLIQASRLVVLSASYTPGDPPILDREHVQALRGRSFVNTARGELVDENALLAEIKAGTLAGVAVDTISGEQDRPNRDRWIAATVHPNVIVTPHIAGATWTSMRRTEDFVTDKLLARMTADGASRP